ncbi:hypothetical protein INT46_004137 [Mucor plumbeus]|uniref:Uncharacterized protein n=1 Tax=Mucor plumbeus TaxID=97098 RepID=A0A8H7QN92_9FUNG|nr:hypothetical protein INT46_004137 [Mucor plumbeus]
MSNNIDNKQTSHYSPESSKSPTKGILQRKHSFKEHEAPEHKLKWDENKLKATEKQQKEQVLMKVDEPNTPYIRYDPVTDKVTNWEDLPGNIRAAHEEPEEFMLDGEKASESPKKSGIAFANEPDEWKKVEEKEKQYKEEAARKRHEEFERKRAQHYYHAGDVLHENLQNERDDSKTSL